MRFKFDTAAITKKQADLRKYDEARAKLGHKFYQKKLGNASCDALIKEMDALIHTMTRLKKIKATARQTNMLAANLRTGAGPADQAAPTHTAANCTTGTAVVKHDVLASKAYDKVVMQIKQMQDCRVKLERLKKVNVAIRQAERVAAILTRAREEERDAEAKNMAQTTNHIVSKRKRAKASVAITQQRSQAADASGETDRVGVEASEDEYSHIEWHSFLPAQVSTADVENLADALVDDMENANCMNLTAPSASTIKQTRIVA